MGILEKLKIFSRGGNKKSVQAALARAARMENESTWNNFKLGRVAELGESIKMTIYAICLEEMQAQIARLTHEREVALLRGDRLDSHQISEIEAHLVAAKFLLNSATSRIETAKSVSEEDAHGSKLRNARSIGAADGFSSWTQWVDG